MATTYDWSNPDQPLAASQGRVFVDPVTGRSLVVSVGHETRIWRDVAASLAAVAPQCGGYSLVRHDETQDLTDVE